MEYRVEFNIRNFEFWSGAEERIREADELDVLDELQELIEEAFFDESPTDTQINDFVWFEVDDWLEEKRQEILSDQTVEEPDFDLNVEVTGTYASDAVEVIEKAKEADCAAELLDYLKSSISWPATHDEVTEAIADAIDWLDEKIEENEEANEEEE